MRLHKHLVETYHTHATPIVIRDPVNRPWPESRKTVGAVAHLLDGNVGGFPGDSQTGVVDISLRKCGVFKPILGVYSRQPRVAHQFQIRQAQTINLIGEKGVHHNNTPGPPGAVPEFLCQFEYAISVPVPGGQIWQTVHNLMPPLLLPIRGIFLR